MSLCVSTMTMKETDLFTLSLFIKPEIYCFSEKSGLGSRMLILRAHSHVVHQVMVLTPLISHFMAAGSKSINRIYAANLQWSYSWYCIEGLDDLSIPKSKFIFHTCKDQAQLLNRKLLLSFRHVIVTPGGEGIPKISQVCM